MQMQEAVVHGVTVVRLFGEFDSASAPAVEQHIEGLAKGEGQCVVLDFTGVPFMSSAGLRVLQKVLRIARGNGGDIRLASVGQPVHTVLHQTGLAQMFKIFPDAEAALAEFVTQAEGQATRARNEVRVVRLEGDLDAAAIPVVEKQLRAEVHAGGKRLVVDLGKVTYMASAGLRVLQGALMSMRGQGGDLRLACVHPQVKKTFDLLGFSPLFKTYDTVDAAIDSFPS